METNVNYTVVGAFVITLTAVIVLTIIWLSSGFSIDKFSTYQLHTQESVSGLNTDSAVEFNGVNVGTVASIDFSTKNPQMVEVLLNVKKNTPITQGTYATLATRGITGITFIELKDRGTDLRPLVALKGQPYPELRTVPSLFTRLDIALTKFSKDFHVIADSIQSVLNKENQESFKNILSNMQRVTGTLSANSKRLDSILQNTAKASANFGPLLQSSTDTMRTLQTQTLPSTYRLLNNLEDVARTLSEVSAQLKQNPSILVRGVGPQPLGPGERR